MSEPKTTTPTDRIMLAVKARSMNFEQLLAPIVSGGEQQVAKLLERFYFQVRFALAKTPKLAECAPESIIQSLYQIAELGLDPSGRLGSAYLVPFKGSCQAIIGYRGFIDLAVRSGAVRSVNAWVVHENDDFDFVAGRTPVHRPKLKGTRGPVYAVWARAKLPGGGTESVVMTLDEVNAIRDRSPSYRYQVSKGGSDSPWITDPDAMARKTAIRQLLKLCPISPEKDRHTILARAYDIEDAEYEVVDEKPPEQAIGKRRVAKLVGAEPPAEEPVPESSPEPPATG